jgi:hypothetical protein
VEICKCSYAQAILRGMDTSERVKEICKTSAEDLRQAIGKNRRVVGLAAQPTYSGKETVQVEGRTVELRYHLHAVLPFGEFPPQEGVTSTLVTAIAEKIQQECGDKALVGAPLPFIVMSPPISAKREHNGLHLRTVVFWDSETLQSKISMDVLVGVLD